mgnify:FL=1
MSSLWFLASFYVVIDYMAATDGIGVDTAYTGKNTMAPRPHFPGEEPSEIELKNWIRDYENVFRESHPYNT